MDNLDREILRLTKSARRELVKDDGRKTVREALEEIRAAQAIEEEPDRLGAILGPEGG